MLSYSLNRRLFIIFGIFTLVVILIAFLVNRLIDSWKHDIIEGKKVLTEVVVEKLDKAAESIVDSLYRNNYLNNDSLPKQKTDFLDQRLSQVTQNELIHIPGIEGGFYFNQLNEFYGYAFPTSPPPIPAFGPPPRSYNIIKEQIITSIEYDSMVVNLHSFDPAVFPLATKPIYVNSKIIGAVWARIHIERDLPALKLNQIIQIAGLFSLAGFLVALFAAVRLRKRMENVRNGLQKLQSDTNFRFEKMPGIFGLVGSSINKLVSQMNEIYNQKQFLERELYQHDKLATLGKLIAGVAHEVKTPLAIIKTRIQIWQHELKKHEGDSKCDVISDESMLLVVNEIDRLSKLVKRLLVFSKPVSNNLELVNIVKLLTQTISLIKIECSEKVKIITQFDENIPMVKCDQNAIEQVFINILTNSIESINSFGEIKIIVRKDENQNNLVIEFIDNGTGIPNEIMNNIFDPFFTTKPNGVGLGLSIAYEVIKAHKGKIMFTQLKPSGTLCKIELKITQ